MFGLKAPADEQRIQIDWEHEGWGWHDPDAVINGADDGLNGVPRLAESLRRVWFETDLGAVAGRVLADGLDALAHDYESGARQLAVTALGALRGVVAALDAPDDRPSDEWWAKVRFAAWHLWKNGRESMGAAIMSALLAALARVEQVVQTSQAPGAWHGAVLAELDACIAARHKSAQHISQAFGAYLERTFQPKLASHEPISVLTLSESSTIRQGLRHAALESGFVLDLRVLESRPLYEGVSLAGSVAEDLASATAAPSPHRITLYADAAAAQAASGVDVVVVGADRIAASGAVSNKTGSLPAVLSAKHACGRARVVVLGESDKIAPPGRPEDHVVEAHDPSQISRAWRAEYNSTRVRTAATALLQSPQPSVLGGRPAVSVEISNVFFEWIPAALIDVYVTEGGEWAADKIAQHSEKLEVEEQRLFGDL